MQNVYRFQFNDGSGVFHYDDTNKQHDLRFLFHKRDMAHMPMPRNDTALMTHISALRDQVIKTVPKEEVTPDKVAMFPNWILSTSLFGFSTPEQAYKWFTMHELLTMEKYPVQVVKYELPDERVLTGDSQTIFQLVDNPKPVETLTVQEFMAKYPPN